VIGLVEFDNQRYRIHLANVNL